jgi:membrane protein YdbS with pleckstrin-like domain
MSDLAAPLRPKRKKVWVDYFVQFRWILVIFVVLPISFTMYFLTYLGVSVLFVVVVVVFIVVVLLCIPIFLVSIWGQ